MCEIFKLQRVSVTNFKIKKKYFITKGWCLAFKLGSPPPWVAELALFRRSTPCSWTNWIDNDVVLVLIYFVLGFICILYCSTVDALYCNLSAQVCANFTVLSYEIENLNPSNSDTLPEIIKKHQYIYE